MPTDSQFLEAAWSTAPAFGLDPTDITLLSHTENVVYRVDVASGDRRVLRLHRPGYNTLAELNSEVTWVKSLAEAGVPVPTALPTDEGEHYVNVTVGNETRYVGVVDWGERATTWSGDRRRRNYPRRSRRSLRTYWRTRRHHPCAS